MAKNELKETMVDSELVYDGRLLYVLKDTVRLPNGNTTTREYIKHVGAVCVVALDDADNIILERQFRYPFGRVIDEIPAGKLDGIEEDPLDAAKRELKEETGYTADTWAYLGSYYPTVAYSNEVIHMYLARQLKKGETNLDSDEFLSVYSRPFKDMLNDVLENKVPDGKTQTAILKAARVLNL